MRNFLVPTVCFNGRAQPGCATLIYGVINKPCAQAAAGLGLDPYWTELKSSQLLCRLCVSVVTVRRGEGFDSAYTVLTSLSL